MTFLAFIVKFFSFLNFNIKKKSRPIQTISKTRLSKSRLFPFCLNIVLMLSGYMQHTHTHRLDSHSKPDVSRTFSSMCLSRAGMVLIVLRWWCVCVCVCLEFPFIRVCHSYVHKRDEVFHNKEKKNIKCIKVHTTKLVWSIPECRVCVCQICEFILCIYTEKKCMNICLKTKLREQVFVVFHSLLFLLFKWSCILHVYGPHTKVGLKVSETSKCPQTSVWRAKRANVLNECLFLKE